jgi:protein-histidine N-methyltransferase
MDWYGDDSPSGGTPPAAGAGIPELLDTLVRGHLPPRFRKELTEAFGVDLGPIGSAPSNIFARDDLAAAGVRLAGFLAELLRSKGGTLRPVEEPPAVDVRGLPLFDWRPPHAAPTDEAMGRFLGWIEERGAELSAIEIATSADAGRGVCARRPIEPGERVLHVPRELIISTAVTRQSPIGRAIDSAGIRLDSSHSRLASWLAVERRDPRTPWWPYFDILPADFPTLPAIYSAADLGWLTGTVALHRAERQIRSIAADHAALRALPSFAAVTLDEFVWARLVVATRVFSITIDGADERALIPLADLLNHHRERETSFGRQDSAAGFDVHALRPFAPGQEVRDSYGNKCSSRFLTSYGFVVADNPHDEAELDVTPPRDNPRAALIARLLWGHPLTAIKPFRVPARRQHPWTQRLLEFLRHGTGDEAAALAALAGAASRALARFPTTLADDDALAADASLSARQRLCVLTRRAEKRVLARFAAGEWIA